MGVEIVFQRDVLYSYNTVRYASIYSYMYTHVYDNFAPATLLHFESLDFVLVFHLVQQNSSQRLQIQ